MCFEDNFQFVSSYLKRSIFPWTFLVCAFLRKIWYFHQSLQVGHEESCMMQSLPISTFAAARLFHWIVSVALTSLASFALGHPFSVWYTSRCCWGLIATVVEFAICSRSVVLVFSLWVFGSLSCPFDPCKGYQSATITVLQYQKLIIGQRVSLLITVFVRYVYDCTTDSYDSWEYRNT